MNGTEWIVDLAVLGVPPLSCGWAWWLWRRHGRDTAIPRWRQVTTVIDLIVFTVSIALGALALWYWHDFSRTPMQPEATRVMTMVGFALAVFGIPFSVMARSWNRVALVVCSLGLLVFYVAMFAAV
jgi:hypothetical protein